MQEEEILLLTCGFWRKSQMSVVQEGHFMMFFCERSVRPPRFLSLIWVIPANVDSRHVLQKLWAQGVVTGRLITFWQIMQLNPVIKKIRKTKWQFRCARPFAISIVSHTFYTETPTKERLICRPFRSLSLIVPLSPAFLDFLMIFLSSVFIASIAFMLAGGDFTHFQRPSASWLSKCISRCRGKCYT